MEIKGCSLATIIIPLLNFPIKSVGWGQHDWDWDGCKYANSSTEYQSLTQQRTNQGFNWAILEDLFLIFQDRWFY